MATFAYPLTSQRRILPRVDALDGVERLPLTQEMDLLLQGESDEMKHPDMDDVVEHNVNVMCLCDMLLSEFNLSREERIGGILGARLHDIGKLYYEKEVHKPGKLNHDERARLDHHPVAGYWLLIAAGVSRADEYDSTEWTQRLGIQETFDVDSEQATAIARFAAYAILTHHSHGSVNERSYPDPDSLHAILNGKHLPETVGTNSTANFLSLMVSVVDQVDALTTKHRAYQPAGGLGLKPDEGAALVMSQLNAAEFKSHKLDLKVMQRRIQELFKYSYERKAANELLETTWSEEAAELACVA